jgi:hypothetical protein
MSEQNERNGDMADASEQDTSRIPADTDHHHATSPTPPTTSSSSEVSQSGTTNDSVPILKILPPQLPPSSEVNQTVATNGNDSDNMLKMPPPPSSEVNKIVTTNDSDRATLKLPPQLPTSPPLTPFERLKRKLSSEATLRSSTASTEERASGGHTATLPTTGTEPPPSLPMKSLDRLKRKLSAEATQRSSTTSTEERASVHAATVASINTAARNTPPHTVQAVASATAHHHAPPRVPTGEIINAKNINQSYDHVNHDPLRHWARNQPTLPNGEVINAKNINQSYDHVNHDPLRHGARNQPTLPNGEVINAKNINQSYDHVQRTDVARNQPPTLTNGDVINAVNINQSYGHVQNSRDHNNGANPYDNDFNTGNRNTINSNSISYDTNIVSNAEMIEGTNNTSAQYTVEAVAVDSLLIVDAKPLSYWQQHNSTLWLVIVVIIIVIASVIGEVCGSGQCTSGTIPASPNGTSIMDAMKLIILLEFLNNITLSGQNITLNGVRAESKALTWMLNQDVTLNATILNSLISNAATFRVRQRYPLITLWFQQRDNVGVFQEQWYNTTGWLQDANECNWYGINCTIMDLGGSVGTQNVVTEVDFNCGTLTKEERTIDDVFVDDGDLPIFDTNNGSCALGNNYIGSIPAELGLLTLMKHLDFSLNELTGTIPASIGLWTALTYFDVSKNNGFYRVITRIHWKLD